MFAILRKWRSRPCAPAVSQQSLAQVFGSVYRDRRWGGSRGQRFFSGLGSHDPDVVAPYVAAAREYLEEFPGRPDVADLGCGDFNVGRKLRDVCGRYLACDVVAELVAHDAARYAALDVDFRCLDIVDDELPAADVAFIRQVLQHLSNDQIARIVPKLARYGHLIVTEHLPKSASFVPNVDHEHGAGLRLAAGSGVVLTAPPFNLRVRSERLLCAVEKYDGVIATHVYRIA
jgi:hypothetical protein